MLPHRLFFFDVDVTKVNHGQLHMQPLVHAVAITHVILVGDVEGLDEKLDGSLLRLFLVFFPDAAAYLQKIECLLILAHQKIPEMLA